MHDTKGMLRDAQNTIADAINNREFIVKDHHNKDIPLTMVNAAEAIAMGHIAAYTAIEAAENKKKEAANDPHYWEKRQSQPLFAVAGR